MTTNKQIIINFKIMFIFLIVQNALRKYADNVSTLKGGENILYLSLQKKFPQAKEIKIKDISGNYITLC